MERQITNDSSRRMHLRPASKADAEGIGRVLASAFRREEGEGLRQSMRLAHDAAERFLVVEREGEVIAAALIASDWLRVGTARVRKGDVGHVAVRRELQGQGIGTRLMEACVRHLQHNGFHLSRLGGLNRFYARSGYVPFPRRYYEFLLTDVRAGAATLPPESLVALAPEQERCVRLYHPRNDWARHHELYDRFHENRTGSRIQERGSGPPSSGEPDPQSLKFVYEQDGVVAGYLFAEEYPNEPSPFEAKVSIHDLAFDVEKPEAFTTLMRLALREALRRGAQRVTARLPFDPLLQQLLTDAALPFSLQELQSGVASNMLLLVDLPGLLKAIVSELTRRHAHKTAGATFTVRLCVGEQAATLVIGPGSVDVTSAPRVDAQLMCDVATFMRWMFGLNGFEEWQVGVTHTLTEEQRRIFARLFPREPCASGPWG